MDDKRIKQFALGLATLVALGYNPRGGKPKERSFSPKDSGDYPIFKILDQKQEEKFDPSVYRSGLPSELIEAGIENVSQEIGDALVRMYRYQRLEKNYKSEIILAEKIQQRMDGFYSRLKDQVAAVDVDKLSEQLGPDNLLVKIAKKGAEKYHAAVERRDALFDPSRLSGTLIYRGDKGHNF